MDTPNKLQIKGLIRFSYLSENGFAKSEQGMTEMREMLYDPARLDRRFALFERLALHSLALQDDQDFKVAVLIGDSFPDAARARLELDLVLSANAIASANTAAPSSRASAAWPRMIIDGLSATSA